MEILHLDQLDRNKAYSYADYLLWKFKERVELLKGMVTEMSAPSTQHQKISGNLFAAIKWHVRKSPCQVFSAPFDVRLPIVSKKKKGDTVVQPDICVVCDASKLDERGCNGAPDLIVEILSPGNSKREIQDKYDIYQESSVGEYWIIFPSEQVLQRYLLGPDGQYIPQRPNAMGEKVGMRCLPGFEVEIDQIFE